LQGFPKATVDVYVEILQADGSTRVAGINAASLALASAGVPMKDLIAACSVGKIEGKLIVDLSGIEDNCGEVDLAFAMMGSKKKITLLQMDGTLSKEEIMELLKMAEKSCEKIYEMQKKMLKEKYKKEKVG
jgi:exosome complex component RRP41